MTATALPGVTSTEADGVPILLAPRSGNTIGGIMFRVGSADETLATAGITHLVEHLALQTQIMADAHVNGQTHSDVTAFFVTGSRNDVVGYLNDVCAALRYGLPTERIETEKEILRSEAGLRPPSFPDRMRLARHGAQGYGIRMLGERGLRRLAPAEVQAWAAGRFTRQNAVAWLSLDELPPDLDLRLPHGKRIGAPPITRVLDATPAYITGLRDGIAVDAIVPYRGIEATAMSLVENVLHRELRRNADIASGVHAYSERLDADHTRISIGVHAPEDTVDAAVNGLIDVLRRLRSSVDEDDLTAARAMQLESVAEWDAAPTAEKLPTIAHAALRGTQLPSSTRRRADIEAVSSDSVRELLARVWSEALWFAPGDLDSTGATAISWSSQLPVRGTTYRRLDDRTASVVVGDDGVSVIDGDKTATVRFAQCALLEAVPDGGRALTGVDGHRVVVEPTLHHGLGISVIRHIDTHVHRDVVVHLPPREPNEIPRPQKPERYSRLRRGLTLRARRGKEKNQ